MQKSFIGLTPDHYFIIYQMVFSVKISANFDKELEVLNVAGSRYSKEVGFLFGVELDKQQILRRQLLELKHLR